MRQDEPASEKAAREAGLDDTIEQTFPASDPPSSIPNPCEYERARGGTGADAQPEHVPPKDYRAGSRDAT